MIVRENKDAVTWVIDPGTIIPMSPGESIAVLRVTSLFQPLFTTLDREYYAPIEDEL
jgi:hypothetical protein